MIAIDARSRTTTRCLVCGFAEIRTDEVVDRGLVLLSECPRCEHRTTWRPSGLEMASAQWPARPGPRRVTPNVELEAPAAPVPNETHRAA